MRNANEGTDVLINVGLDGLPTANKLWAKLCSSHAESGFAATNVKADLTLVGSAVGKTGLTCASRIVDLGSIDMSASNSGSAKSIVVFTDDPANAGAKIIAIQDLNAGAAVDLAAAGGVIIDDLSIAIDYLVSGSVA